MKNKKILYIFLHIEKCAGTTIAYHIRYNFKEDEIISLYPGHGFFNIVKKEYQYLRNQQDIEDYLKSLTKEQKDKIKVIYGHAVYYGIHKFFDKNPRYVTFLREPFERIVSRYNHMRKTLELPFNKKVSDGIGILPFTPNIKKVKKIMTENGKILSFESWLKDRNNKNPVIRLLIVKKFVEEKLLNNISAKDIQKALKKFYFIGMFENFNKDSLLLYQELGINRFFTKKNISRQYFSIKNLVPIKRKKLKEKFLLANILDKKLHSYALDFNRDFKSRIKGLPKKLRCLKIKRNLILPFSNIVLLMKLAFGKILMKLK